MGTKVNKNRIITFITGTRADFGKLKSLINELIDNTDYTIHIFVTGMHMLAQYGYTCSEVEKCGFKNIYKYINQNTNDTMDTVLSKTVAGFSDYVKEINPDMIVVHGDRVEAMACAIVGSLNNILVSHIEGGELSGTVDEIIRHAISKLSHLHFVANIQSKNRLIQLGEEESNIHIIGSPDFDIMVSKKLPNINHVKDYYDITFDSYHILLFHSVTTEIEKLKKQTKTLIKSITKTNENFVAIYPNNDPGSSIIINEYKKLEKNEHIKLFPSMRFEYFLTLLKNCTSIIGNSSAGIREAPFYKVPSVNIGSRQNNRSSSESIINIEFVEKDIMQAFKRIKNIHFDKSSNNEFGEGDSNIKFCKILKNNKIWNTNTQKYFVDLQHIQQNQSNHHSNISI